MFRLETSDTKDKFLHHFCDGPPHAGNFSSWSVNLQGIFLNLLNIRK